MTWTDGNTGAITPEKLEVDRLAGTLAALHPEDILFYHLRHEKVTCACGVEHFSSRMWLTYKHGRGRDARPMGLSERLYAKKEIKQTFSMGGTPFCSVCIDNAMSKLEPWKPRASGAISEGNFTTDANGAAKPRTPKAERSLDDILGSI